MPLAAMPRPTFLQESCQQAGAIKPPSPPALATKSRRKIVIRRTGSSVAKRRLEVEEEEEHTVESASKRARVEEVVELLAGLEVEVLAA